MWGHGKQYKQHNIIRGVIVERQDEADDEKDEIYNRDDDGKIE